MEWAFGVTTVPERFEQPLERTISSLFLGGFYVPHLFVDGSHNHSVYAGFGLDVTVRWPRIGAFGNWWLGMWELYIRHPRADLYAMFQDDIVCCRNVRQYLEQRSPVGMTYMNLCMYPQNYDAGFSTGWHGATKRGLGAQGLVFSRAAIRTLLSARSDYLLNKPQFPRGHQNLDGSVADAMADAGYMEVVHNPSLIAHVGEVSTIPRHGRQPDTAEFPGEEFDAMSLI